MKLLLSLTFFLLLTLNATFGQTSNEETRIVQTLKAFEQAIVDNDVEAASALLADEIHILESNAIETKEEYLSHHFHSDGKFLSAMNRTVDAQSVFIEGDVAWVTTRSYVQGEYNDRSINLNSLELAVLKKVSNQWKITALHWSSSPQK